MRENKGMFTGKSQEESYQMPQDDKLVYVYRNTACSVKKLAEKREHLKAYCEENGYLSEGSMSISVPMSDCGVQFRCMIDYCHREGISRILVDNMNDIGRTFADVAKVIGALCAQGFEVEVAHNGQVFPAANQDEEQSFTMGGMQ